MKLVLYAMLAIIAAAVLGSYAQEDPGYIMISFRDITIETLAKDFNNTPQTVFA